VQVAEEVRKLSPPRKRKSKPKKGEIDMENGKSGK